MLAAMESLAPHLTLSRFRRALTRPSLESGAGSRPLPAAACFGRVNQLRLRSASRLASLGFTATGMPEPVYRVVHCTSERDIERCMAIRFAVFCDEQVRLGPLPTARPCPPTANQTHLPPRAGLRGRGREGRQGRSLRAPAPHDRRARRRHDPVLRPAEQARPARGAQAVPGHRRRPARGRGPPRAHRPPKGGPQASRVGPREGAHCGELPGTGGAVL